MTAVTTLIADLERNTISLFPQPVVVPIADFIAALEELEAGLIPAGPEAANTFLAGPATGAPADPTFRVFANADFASTLLLSIGNLDVNSPTVPANGLSLGATNTLEISTNSVDRWVVTAGGNFNSATSGGPRLAQGPASHTTPGIVPNLTGLTTGVGGTGTDMSEIIAGAEVGRWIAGGLQLGTGIGTAAALNDYEIGTWTPADASGAGLTFTGVSANYTKIGNMIFAYCQLTYPATADVSASLLSGLPFGVANAGYANQGVLSNATATAGSPIRASVIAGGTEFEVFVAAGIRATNSQLSGGTLSFLLIYPAT